MAHEVKIKLNESLVAHKDIEIEVKTDEGKLGTLLISKGNIEWLPAKNFVNKHRMSWKNFSELMMAEGKPRKVK